MAYAIVFLDKPGTAMLRLELRDAHIAYMDANKDRVLASGGLLSDDGTTGQGAVMIIDTDDRAEAEAFVAADPFFTGGLYGEHTVSRWRKAFFNFERLLP